jgi:hypothetical protein
MIFVLQGIVDQDDDDVFSNMSYTQSTQLDGWKKVN